MNGVDFVRLAYYLLKWTRCLVSWIHGVLGGVDSGMFGCGVDTMRLHALQCYFPLSLKRTFPIPQVYGWINSEMCL
jgi:hypothetical protein